MTQINKILLLIFLFSYCCVALYVVECNSNNGNGLEIKIKLSGVGVGVGGGGGGGGVICEGKNKCRGKCIGECKRFKCSCGGHVHDNKLNDDRDDE